LKLKQDACDADDIALSGGTIDELETMWEEVVVV
jgi:hypothetical protein